jgi:hypothetical protein
MATSVKKTILDSISTFLIPCCFLLIPFINACRPSSKVGWTSTDKENVRKELQKADARLSHLGRKKATFISCYLEKLEAHYTNLEEANQDETGCTKLATSCLKSLFKNK